jgi:hypothetical protein
VSIYALQKAIRDVNRDPAKRSAFFESPATAASQYVLTEAEREALQGRDYAALYAMGVHGLLLRPFSILHAVSEADYLRAIRGTGST